MLCCSPYPVPTHCTMIKGNELPMQELWNIASSFHTIDNTFRWCLYLWYVSRRSRVNSILQVTWWRKKCYIIPFTLMWLLFHPFLHVFPNLPEKYCGTWSWVLYHYIISFLRWLYSLIQSRHPYIIAAGLLDVTSLSNCNNRSHILTHPQSLEKDCKCEHSLNPLLICHI